MGGRGKNTPTKVNKFEVTGSTMNIKEKKSLRKQTKWEKEQIPKILI